MTDNSADRALRDLRSGWIVEDSWSMPIVFGNGDQVEGRMVSLRLSVTLVLDGTTDTIVLTMHPEQALLLCAGLVKTAATSIYAEPPDEDEEET